MSSSSKQSWLLRDMFQANTWPIWHSSPGHNSPLRNLGSAGYLMWVICRLSDVSDTQNVKIFHLWYFQLHFKQFLAAIFILVSFTSGESDTQSCQWPCAFRGPFYQHGLSLIPASINNHMLCKVWYEITYWFLNFNGANVEVIEWISNFIPNLKIDVITYPCWD